MGEAPGEDSGSTVVAAAEEEEEVEWEPEETAAPAAGGLGRSGSAAVSERLSELRIFRFWVRCEKT